MTTVSMGSPTFSDSGFSIIGSSCETLSDISTFSTNSTANSIRSIFSKLRRKKSSPNLHPDCLSPSLRGAKSVPDLPKVHTIPPPVPTLEGRQLPQAGDVKKPRHIPLGPTAERYQRLGSELIAETSALRAKKLERLTGRCQGTDKSKLKLINEMQKNSPNNVRRSLSTRQRKQSLQDLDSDSEPEAGDKSPQKKLNFDRLVLSDETVKVSLTSNRLNTIEAFIGQSGRKHQARQMMAREPLTRGRLPSPPPSPLGFTHPPAPQKLPFKPAPPLAPPREFNAPVLLPRIPPSSPPCTLNTLVEEQESEDEEERVVQMLTEITLPPPPVIIECVEEPQEEDEERSQEDEEERSQEEDDEERVVQILIEIAPPPPVVIECEEGPQEEETITIRPRPASLVICRTKLIDHELAHGKAIPELDNNIWTNTVNTPTDADKNQSDELSRAMKVIEDLQRERDELIEQLRFLGH